MLDELNSILVHYEYSSHLMAGMLFLIAAVLYSPQRISSLNTRPVRLACALTAALQLVIPLAELGVMPLAFMAVGEILVVGTWALALCTLLETHTGARINPLVRQALKLVTALACVAALAKLLPIQQLTNYVNPLSRAALGQLLLTLVALVLIEQLFRNSNTEQRHNIKYVGIGLFALLFFDLYCFSYISVFNSVDTTFTYARGSINILAASLLILGALRTEPQQSISISRTMTFYTTSIIVAGVFLLLMAAAGYYIRVRGGSWSGTLQIILLAFTFVALTSIAVSRSARGQIQVFVSKHFFHHKYDYRNTWLNLIKTLSQPIDQEDFYTRCITATANVFDSPGGSLWLLNDEDYFEPVANWNIEIPGGLQEATNSAFAELLEKKEWVFAPNDKNRDLFAVNNNALPAWARHIDNLWIIAPLLVGSRLSGFFLLLRPPYSDKLIWEDLDVLKTVGRQLASYILRQKSAEQLAESKQFDTYNRLTAFIMHDLKNLIAQQALVVQNANKHKENPAFVEDAINTIDNSVQRMSHLLKRLQSSNQNAPQRSISVEKILLETIRKSTDRQPIPTLRKECPDVNVVADRDQLTMVLMHVIRNAQDATETNGFIDVVLRQQDDRVCITIEDNGCGMDKDFVKNRLFKPFESTKSSMGMGIGAYQVREFIQNLGGNISVESELNIGTTVNIQLPVSAATEQAP